ncbi:MAG TPA: hypothetical protein P5305_01160 [Rubrivivax sp.]|nr:hypothetical protein [Rubrivivax sp.]HRY86461.1 hypothetical protein [Rubrivivax sp.]
MAYLSYYFHWPYAQVMALDHRERRQWARELARVNKRINDASQGDGIDH